MDLSKPDQPNQHFQPGALYVVAFAQAIAPHIGLLIPHTEERGVLVHIRVDRATSPHWQYQCRNQRITGEMTMTSLMRLSRRTDFSVETLRAAAEDEPAPENDAFGECAPWVWRVVQRLADEGHISLAPGSDVESQRWHLISRSSLLGTNPSRDETASRIVLSRISLCEAPF